MSQSNSTTYFRNACVQTFLICVGGCKIWVQNQVNRNTVYNSINEIYAKVANL